MNSIATLIRKELRAYFLSPVALIFLGIFLVAINFVFFTQAKFFARGIADIRPLFEWLPILLIFLVSAITMRAWSEEQKMGTLEILLTLPLKTRNLVLGKLAAGMLLVIMALVLTLPLPIMVANIGDLDWGPVFGGYLGAIMLAATYMSIGMCVSSRTDNQIVSLMVTLVICGLLYLIGSDSVVAFFGNDSAQLLRSLGSGSRFESIERGVIDLRDLAYYGSLTTFFVILGVYFLELKRVDTAAAPGRRRTKTYWITIILAAVNVIGCNSWLAPVTATRVDLTDDGRYSISDTTQRILAGLKDPITISGYFSEKTHPKLAPLVPQIRDLLTEYQIHGSNNVKVQILDPSKDEELEQELAELYNIKSMPLRISSRHEEAVVNSFFHVLIQCGDQFQALSFGDLIEVHADENDIDVRLRNLEYDLTSTVKKVTGGFQNIEAMFARMEGEASLTFFVTPDSLPEEFKEIPEMVRKVASSLTEVGDGKFSFNEVIPGDDAQKREIYEKYGFRPMAVDIFGEKHYYLNLSLRVGDKYQRVSIQNDPTEAGIRSTIEASIKRVTPGFLKTIALLSEDPKAPPPNPQIPQQFQPPPPRPDYRALQESLAEEFTFKRVQATDGIIPGDVDVLIVGMPGSLDDKQQFAVDQFLMRGGSVIALAGAYDMKIERGELSPTQADAGLLQLIKQWGVTVKGSFVLDKNNARFPVPVIEERGRFKLKRIEMMSYPFFPDIRSEGFNDGHVAVSGLQNVIMNWSSPLEVAKDLEGIKADVLVSTSSGSWTYSSTKVQPDSFENAQSEFAPADDQKLASHPVAVALTGKFSSFFADKPSPLFGAEQNPQKQDQAQGDRTGRTIKESASDSRLVVVGSSAFVSDLIAGFGNQPGGGAYRGNFLFIRNLIDWSLADTDLLEIRTAGSFARTLKPLEESQRNKWEAFNYGFVLLALAIVVIIAITRRRNTKSIISTEVK